MSSTIKSSEANLAAEFAAALAEMDNLEALNKDHALDVINAILPSGNADGANLAKAKLG